MGDKRDNPNPDGIPADPTASVRRELLDAAQEGLQKATAPYTNDVDDFGIDSEPEANKAADVLQGAGSASFLESGAGPLAIPTKGLAEALQHGPDVYDAFMEMDDPLYPDHAVQDELMDIERTGNYQDSGSHDNSDSSKSSGSSAGNSGSSDGVGPYGNGVDDYGLDEWEELNPANWFSSLDDGANPDTGNNVEGVGHDMALVGHGTEVTGDEFGGLG